MLFASVVKLNFQIFPNAERYGGSSNGFGKIGADSVVESSETEVCVDFLDDLADVRGAVLQRRAQFHVIFWPHSLHLKKKESE